MKRAAAGRDHRLEARTEGATRNLGRPSGGRRDAARRARERVEPILDDLRADLRELGDLMTRRAVVVADERVAAATTGVRLELDDARRLEQLPSVAAMPGLAAALSTPTPLLGPFPRRIARRRLRRVARVACEPSLELSDTSLESRDSGGLPLDERRLLRDDGVLRIDLTISIPLWRKSTFLPPP